ncbi:mitochondrial S-adenosylmethionine carrier protein isoform X1 [Tamandua tetradactyla]|uniref:mitochondrial S-adenosylmethionine carrier protein isoform X1 n=2 Tax=Tamandua tetradactyla TaxID=48850 RepID=UPI00405404A4
MCLTAVLQAFSRASLARESSLDKVAGNRYREEARSLTPPRPPRHRPSPRSASWSGSFGSHVQLLCFTSRCRGSTDAYGLGRAPADALRARLQDGCAQRQCPKPGSAQPRIIILTLSIAMDRPGFMASLVAGGVAGVSVDLILFPLDTIKTRLQSPQGFNKAGGFRGIYAGVPSAAIGSFPNAAAFFITYEYVKWVLSTDSSSYLMPVKHMLAASAGEVVACLIRVPSELVKQRAQVSASSRTFQIFSNILYQEGILGLYRGYTSTVLREIPFSLVQFPLWESLKALWSWRQDHVVDSWQSAVCGAFAGGFAAAVTTPLDVAKTRIMLAKAGSSTASGNVLSALHGVWRTQGFSGLFSGIFPRMAAISLGGFIFLGAYDQTRSLLLEFSTENP